MAAGLAALAVCAALAAGCGDEGGRPQLKVSAAASLKPAFERYATGASPAEPRFSFAGSDELAAQIRQGARPDVYAAANVRLPRALHAEGLAERPRIFATNRLVAMVRRGAGIGSLRQLARDGMRIAVGAPAVPVGSYTQRALGRLPEGARILANVRSREPDAGAVAGKVARGGADAGFVYATDARAFGDEVRTLELPPRTSPRIAYAAVVVRGAASVKEARAFIAGLTAREGRAALAESGFGPP